MFKVRAGAGQSLHGEAVGESKGLGSPEPAQKDTRLESELIDGTLIE